MKIGFAFAALAFVSLACSSSSDSTGSGGHTGSGGSAATGGTSATGGKGGTGGGSAGASGAAGASSGDTWTNYAQGFFSTYCIECHGAGNPNRDYTTIDDVIRDKALIRCGVASTLQSGCTSTSPQPKQFPISNTTKTNPKPSDAERDRIVAWIDAGLPQ